jgi:hypothetical protein
LKKLKLACLAFLALCAAAPGFSQGVEASVRISPAVPRPGELVLLSISVPSVAASELEALEPELDGPLRYLGSYLRPLVDAAAAGDGTEGSVIELRLLALSQGRAEISRLGYAVQGRPVYLGSYVVEIAPAPGGAEPARPGSWLAPDSAYPFAPFRVRIVGPSGEALPIATPAVRGAMFYPLGPLPASSFLVSITGDEGITLPAMDLDAGGDALRVAARRVDRRPLPAKVEASRAVGRWSVELSTLSHTDEAFIGDIVVVEAKALGIGSAAFAAAPRLRVLGPDKARIALLQEGPAMGDSRVEGESFSGESSARMSFQAMEAGIYTIELEPYPWFDTGAASERSATAQPLFLRVKARAYEAWRPSVEQRELLDALIASAPAAPAGARRADTAGRLAQAARALLEGDALAALHAGKTLERAFWPPRGASALSGLAANALGLEPASQEDLLPPPFWFALAALPCAVLAAALALLRGRPAHTPYGKAKPGRRRAFFALPAILCLCLVVMCVVSLAERSRERAIVFVSALRAVPDEGASSPFSVAPGSQANIVSEGGAWLFLEFGDGRSAWIRADLIGRY